MILPDKMQDVVAARFIDHSGDPYETHDVRLLCVDIAEHLLDCKPFAR
jgi:hypothetical protein